VVVSTNDGRVVSVTHNGFRAKGATRERVLIALRKQDAEEEPQAA
jgi:hypothetical protein